MKYLIKTWGCQMNALDSDKMAGLLQGMGYLPTEEEREADVILLNTCSVREGPENKVFTELGRLHPLKRRKPLILGLVGCVAQQEKEQVFKRAPYVDLVMGPRGVRHLPELLAQASNQRAIDTQFHDDSILFPDQAIARTNPTKAYITVMEGCNKRCTFCIVPTTRGREVCRPLADIVQEARRAVDGGYKEVELLGQNVNCWREGDRTFPDLLAAVSDLPGLRRLRFTTSHPRHFPLAAADLMAERENLCPYLHLPVQAGSDRVLKLMRRQYDQAWYLELVRQIRERLPHIALSTDVIVGFPSETEEDFQQTLNVVRQVEYDTLFSFRYSPRPGTPAAGMEPVPEAVARERHQRLLDLQLEIQTRRFAAMEGRVVEVLVEGESKKGGQAMGRTSDNKVVNFAAARPVAVNTFVNVRITQSAVNSLVGELA
ncbi:MAG: tRNA (N6-isopentenyl adenosine(37)-C2)-methylthiotransferase MiaB [Acidobacteriota bacterium]